MQTESERKSQIEAWEAAAAAYIERQPQTGEVVHYGPWSPDEAALGLLGKVAGQRVLELGCGGGQNCVALARQGAEVCGLDSSSTQLAHAAALAADTGAPVRWVQGDAASPADLPAGPWDLILAVNLFQYLPDMRACLAGYAALLAPGGRLLCSVEHPVRACFWDEEYGEVVEYPARAYWDQTPYHFTFPDTPAALAVYPRTLAAWLELLAAAGLALGRLLEPTAPTPLLDELWPLDDPRAPLRLLPHCLIIVAEKGAAK